MLRCFFPCVIVAACAAPAERGAEVVSSPLPASPPAPAVVQEPTPTVPAPVQVEPTPAPLPTTRAEIVLVPLGPFPDDLLDAIEARLHSELAVEVRRHEPVALPQSAWYGPRKRYRAEKLLDHLTSLVPDGAPETTRMLGLTQVDISTTKEPFEDWGIFGLGRMPGDAAVVSMYRLKKKARGREHLRFRVSIVALHEAGHTFGLDHCPEPRCPMQDAEGSIENTDASAEVLGPDCRAELEAAFPVAR